MLTLSQLKLPPLDLYDQDHDNPHPEPAMVLHRCSPTAADAGQGHWPASSCLVRAPYKYYIIP